MQLRKLIRIDKFTLWIHFLTNRHEVTTTFEFLEIVDGSPPFYKYTAAKLLDVRPEMDRFRGGDHRELNWTDTIDKVPVPWAGHFQ